MHQDEFAWPGKSTDRAFTGISNDPFWAACLDRQRFALLEEARQIVETRRTGDDTERPLQALNQRTSAVAQSARATARKAVDSPFGSTNPGAGQ
jgi:hypothetical protein